ncbi:hypothetical protein [Luteolibacter sp. LG18]|uniref:hypothetical protein n=1 Tax=Luteolibacter sp. LG18 TaxID=2819286 RepID=UPI002B304F84|nr:hypothetical protein llg_21120 [Luteolibacter sp. LG18]
MKGQTLIGVILIIVGAILLAYDGFTTTKRENIIDAGPIKVQADVQEHHHVPPIIGWAVLGVGVLLTVVGVKQK